MFNYFNYGGEIDTNAKEIIIEGEKLRTKNDLFYLSLAIAMKENKATLDDVKNKKDLFYIDNNIITFHTPNIDNVFDIVDNKELKFRIIGYNSIKSTSSDTLIETSTAGVDNRTDIIKSNINNKTLVSDFLYKDYALIGNNYTSDFTYTYKVHMWNKTNSLSGWVKGLKLDNSSYSNEEAKKLGLRNSNFEDSYGGHDDNISTAREMTRLYSSICFAVSSSFSRDLNISM